TVAQTLNYSGAISATDTTYSSLSYLSLSAYLGATWKINWLRTRAYPPSGAMPAVSFGAVQAASTAPTLPSGITNFVQLNLSASWNVGHGAYGQQQVNITESTYSSYIAYNNNLANFEYFYANGTIIPAWIESNSSGKLVTWVKIKNTTTTLYLGFASKTTNLLSSSGTSGIGEAPQLSSTYAQYDDGASVFPFYDNFKGTSLNTTKWTNNIANVGGTLTINNGMSYTRGSSGNDGIFIYTNYNFSSGIFETYGAIPSGGSSGSFTFATFGLAKTSGYSYVGVGDLNSVYGLSTTTSSNADNIVSGLSGGTFIWQIFISSATPSTISASQNYGTQISSSADMPTLPLPIMYQDQYNTGINLGPFYWVRVRAYPPSGTMPSVTFGAVQSNLPTLTITPTLSTYGSNITITATCPSSSDSCAIAYPNLTTTLATGTGSATYTYPAYALAAGTYAKYYAVDKTSGLNSTAQTLTINKNSTTLTWLKQGKNSVYGLTQNTTAKINTHNNQLSANLYLNGNLIGSTNTIITNLQSALGTYSYTFNTTGNTNYTAASIKYNYTISAYKFLIAKVNSTAYETSTQGYAYEINVSSLVGNVILEEDGIAIASLSPTGTLPSAQWFNFTYAIPLLAVNNTAVSFNAVIDVSNTLTTVNSTTQHLLQNYFTSGGPKYNPILTGSGETFFINITQVKPLNAASVLNATLIVGNQTVPLQTVLPYKYYFQYSSFVPSLYGLANPAGKTPTAYTTKGTIKLGFDGSSAYRNLTLSPLTIYNPYLVVCNSTTPKAFSWSFYNASNLKQITTNTLISGYFVPKKGLYTGNIINGTAAGFTAAASNDIYSTCIYPSWASFSTYGTFLINNANYSTAQFMLNNQATNNVSTPLKIYLQQITNPSSYDIVVENGTNNFISAIVQEELYNF
ncbi:MAG: hypothetical protein QW478_14715, partial [Candidatus Micrarchaeaceae archaeon]